MELRNLHSFLRIAELGSFTRAAEDLSYAQSTLTMQIQQMEAELGFPLFERIGKKILLTENGQKLITYANQMVHLEQQIQTIGNDGIQMRGELRIGVVESIMHSLLPDVLEAYHDKCPLISVSVQPGITSALFDLLFHNEVDLIFTLGQKIEVKDCVCAGRHQESAVFVASSKHPLTKRKRILLDEVLDEPFIETGNNTFLQQQLNEQSANRGKQIISYLRTESSSMIIQLVEKNLGLAFLPEYMTHQAENCEQLIKILPVKDFHFSFYTQMFYHKNKWATPQMAEMMRIVKAKWELTDMSMNK